MEKANIYLSVVVPVRNEEKNIPVLHEELLDVLRTLKRSSEIIYVDDGSTDLTFEQIKTIALNDQRVTAVKLARHSGQTMAIAAGIDLAKGEAIILMDGDLQNDPRDIPVLLTALSEGYDLVSGWRRKRKDAFITKKIPSKVANFLISKLTGVSLHDFGCTLKAYRASVIAGLDLYGESHRLIPIYAAMQGANIKEVVVNHRPRRHGKSHYGLWRAFKVLLDIFIARFFAIFSSKPIYIFGGSGLVALFFSIFLGVIVIVRRLFFLGEWVSPLLLISLILFAIGVQFLLLGILAEVLIRVYFKSSGKKPFLLQEIVAKSHHR
ncbi:MAG: glycosyltransferase family 2 protein [Candidatus Omnitrophica bacterium]|nr:glycosyltransferase family 2 protein [Candidatus Omnitrophota bacterium]